MNTHKFNIFILSFLLFLKPLYSKNYYKNKNINQYTNYSLPTKLNLSQNNNIKISCNKTFLETHSTQETKLEQLIWQLIENNPKLAARQLWVDAIKLKAKRARLPKNPKLKYQSKDNEHLGQKAFTRESRYGLYQKIPFPGKLRLKMEAEYKNAEFFISREESVKLDLILELKKLYQEFYLNYVILKIKEISKTKTAKAIDKAQKKYGETLEILEAKISHAKLIDKIFTQKQEAKSIKNNINALLNVPLSTPISKPESTFHGKIKLNKENLIKKAFKYKPEIAGRHALIDKNKTQAKLARRNYFPDIDLEVMIQRKKDLDRYAWYVKIGFDLPIWANLKQKRESDEHEAKALSHLFGLQHLKNQIAAKINTLILEIETLDNRINIYEQKVLPVTKKIFKFKEEKYKSGKLELVDFINEIIILEKEKVHYAEYKAKREILIAKLEREIGTAL